VEFVVHMQPLKCVIAIPVMDRELAYPKCIKFDVGNAIQ
jgi:hypothetical protein